MQHRPESDLPTDGRTVFQWESKYPKEARTIMLIEAGYLIFLFLGSILSLFLIYRGDMATILNIEEYRKATFNNIMYCISAGLLGGVTFSIKIFYRAIARGMWHADRKYWRWMAPLMSLSVSILIAAFMNNDILGRASHAIAIGYFAGYFSEHAMGKMYDIAAVLFSSPR